jgi:hypothetical protein
MRSLAVGVSRVVATAGDYLVCNARAAGARGLGCLDEVKVMQIFEGTNKIAAHGRRALPGF